ncbi:cupin domain-containing protein [Paenibacillus albicereus]|uniref:Cupin domain-containing protein n=1 Tax=Paenibacillus albicereus TaxID=2726185 RepID=A0A6H2H0V0_9BACL|nr:cupin domain-containing protein [Paenibacillus albicereus]QJC52978.1 cupin domain-containing protein [Paenibacillus albicereus]
MKIYQLPGREVPIDAFSSEGVMFSGITRHEGRIQLSSMRIEAGGTVGRHEARTSQLFLLIDGEGWVSGGDGQRIAVKAGQAAYWEAGEAHESGTRTGMTVIVAEGEQLVVEMEELASF